MTYNNTMQYADSKNQNFAVHQEILSSGDISDTILRMLVEQILIHQREDKSLDINNEMIGDFHWI